MAKYNKPKCPNCDSQFVYTRITTKERVCRVCGHVEKIGGKQNEKSN